MANRPPMDRAACGQHCELNRQQCELDNKNSCDRGRDSKERLGEPGGEYCVCHLHSPLIELIER